MSVPTPIPPARIRTARRSSIFSLRGNSSIRMVVPQWPYARVSPACINTRRISHYSASSARVGSSTSWRQFIDYAGHNLRQLPEELLLRHAGTLGKRLDDVRPEGIFELTRGNGLVRSGANPRVDDLSLSTLPETLEQTTQTFEQAAAFVRLGPAATRLRRPSLSVAASEQRPRSNQCEETRVLAASKSCRQEPRYQVNPSFAPIALKS